MSKENDMLSFNVISEVKTLVSSIKGLKKSRESFKKTIATSDQEALERDIQHRQRMMDIEREHELRMKMQFEQAAAQTALQESKMKAFDEAEVARQSLSNEIDELLLKLKDPNVLDKEAVLLELHSLNNQMHEVVMAALNT